MTNAMMTIMDASNHPVKVSGCVLNISYVIEPSTIMAITTHRIRNGIFFQRFIFRKRFWLMWDASVWRISPPLGAYRMK